MAARKCDLILCEDAHFTMLFEDVLNYLIDRYKVDECDIDEGVENARGSFIGGPSGACDIENYRCVGDLFGYFYWSSPISAGLAREKVLRAKFKCQKFRTTLERPELKIVSFGGGTGSDIVGLCSALHESKTLQKLQLTLLDVNKNWKSVFNVVEQFLREKSYGNCSDLFRNVEVVTKFMPVNLLDYTIKEYDKDLKEANIVWVKSFLSILQNDAKRFEVTERLVSKMSPGALLVVIDSPAYDDFDRFDDLLRRIYTSRTEGYSFDEFPEKIYGRGLCRFSNNEIIILVKKDNN